MLIKDKKRIDKFYKEKFNKVIEKLKAGKNVSQKDLNDCICVLETILNVKFKTLPNQTFPTYVTEYEGLKWFVMIGQGSFYYVEKNE